MLKCLATTGTKCNSYSYDSGDKSCAFSSNSKPTTGRSVFSSFYEIETFNYPAAGVTFSPGDCKWKSASDSDWSKVAGCKGHTTRRACVSDSNCEYEYFTDFASGFKYFTEADKAPSSDTSLKETFSGMNSLADCAKLFIEYGGETSNVRLSYTWTITGSVCKLYASNEDYDSSSAPDDITLTAAVGTTFYGLSEK